VNATAAGTVSALYLAKATLRESEDDMNVADIMTSPAHTCSADESLDRVARIMWEHDSGVVPVVDRQGRAIAMITDRDICMAALTQGRSLAEIRVAVAMSKLVYTCHPDDRVSAAERTMRTHQVRRLPVVNDAGRIVGVLSISDIGRARVTAHQLPSDLDTTLAAIGKPRSEPAIARAKKPERAAALLAPLRRSYPGASDLSGSLRMPPPPIRDPSSLFRF
jgi:CBS domain-containing protein